MVFTSLSFICFFSIVFIIHWLLSVEVFGSGSVWTSIRAGCQNILVIVASLLFYGWINWKLCFLLMICTGCAYFCGLIIYRIRMSHGHNWIVKLAVAVEVFMSIGSLCLFKYYNFFAESISIALNSVHVSTDIPTLNLVLPLGISFYSFMAVSYVVDVYRGTIDAEKRPLVFFAYITFFPQLLSGPIGRAPQMIPQFSRLRRFDNEMVMQGFCQILGGAFQKLIVADTLALYVDKVFECPQEFGGLACIVACVFFSMQIYCDFAGYSNMAIGLGRMLGIELMQNFNTPYLALTFSDFWRRWHISLSTWFRDYVYIPLGGNRVGLVHLIFNTWIVFLLSGLWHGANWTFVAWGGLHALYLSFGVIKKKLLQRKGISQRNDFAGCYRFIKIIWVDACVFFAWIFFRVESFDGLSEYLQTVVNFNAYRFSINDLSAGSKFLMMFCALDLVLFTLHQFIPSDFKFKTSPKRIVYVVTVFLTISLLKYNNGAGDFIYFQF